MQILGLPGSLRRDSHNRALLRAAGRLLPPSARLDTYDALKAIPPFDEDDEPTPAAVVERLRRAVRAADALIVATPEYNGSVPGQLKNALDWLSRPYERNALRNKPVLVIGASTGMFGAVWAQADARRILGLTGARVLDAELPVATAHQRIARDGSLADGDLAERLAGLLARLCGEAAGLDRAA